MQANIDNDMSPLDLAKQQTAEYRLTAEFWREQERIQSKRTMALAQQIEGLLKENEVLKFEKEGWEKTARSLRQENDALLELLDYKPPYDQLTDAQVEEISKVLVKVIAPYLGQIVATLKRE